MKNIYLMSYDKIDDTDEQILEEAISTFENDLTDARPGNCETYYQNLDHAGDPFLYEMTRLFGRHVDRMYIFSCIDCNDFGCQLSVKDKAKVCDAVYQAWMKDESSLSICRISDCILKLVDSGEMSVDELAEKTGKELLAAITEII